MLAGKDMAGVTSAYEGGTTIPKSYDIQKGDMTYRFWDTCGLNEGEEGNVPAKEAIESLVNHVKIITINLIIYCVRGRFTDIVGHNYDWFCREICQGKVPTVLVVTGLEQEDKDKWWTTNEVHLKRFKLALEGHACVTTYKGRDNRYEKEYDESAAKVWKLVEANCNPTSWAMSPEWYNAIIERVKKFFRPFKRIRKHKYVSSFIGNSQIHFNLVNNILFGYVLHRCESEALSNVLSN